MQAHVYDLLLQERLQRIVLPIVLHQYHLCMACVSRNAYQFGLLRQPWQLNRHDSKARQSSQIA